MIDNEAAAAINMQAEMQVKADRQGVALWGI
jgi:hypothetical protein